MLKMSKQEFTDKIDGIINDFEAGIINGTQLRSAILDVMIEILIPYLDSGEEK